MAKKIEAKKKAKKRPVKVWHIYDFGNRFEIANNGYYGEKPLEFVRAFVGSGKDDAAISYNQQMKAVERSKNRHTINSVFLDLVKHAANHSRCYRGYLLDPKKQPASNPEIAEWEGLAAKDMTKLLKEMEKIGLIERVDLPPFDPDDNKPTDEDDTPAKKTPTKKKRTPAKKTATGKKKKAGTGSKKGESEAAPEGSRETPKNPEIPSEIGNRKNEKAEVVTENGNTEYQQEKKIESKKEQQRKQNTQLAKASRVSESEANATGNQNSQRTASPPSTKDKQSPTNPTDSEAGGTLQDRTNGLSSPLSANLTSRLDDLYDPSVFASRVLVALAVPCPVGSPKRAQELGCYASLWDKALASGLPPSTLAKLWDKAVKEAVGIGGRRRRVKFTKSPEAVWCSVFNKRLRSAKKASCEGGLKGQGERKAL